MVWPRPAASCLPILRGHCRARCLKGGPVC